MAITSLLALYGCDREGQAQKSVPLAVKAAADAPIVPPPFDPPVTQTAECVGFDEQNQTQTITLENRWVPAEKRSVMFVRGDSTHLLPDGIWLENQNSRSGFTDKDRKYGLIEQDWNDERFSRRVGDRYAVIIVKRTSLASAVIHYFSRPYKYAELTPQKFSDLGSISLAGKCTLFVNGKIKNLDNASSLLRPM